MSRASLLVLACLLACASSSRALRKTGGADKLSGLLSEAASANAVSEPKAEPALDAEQAGSAKEATDSLQAAQKNFNAAGSADETDEEKALEGKMAAAMATPPVLGAPDRTMPAAPKALACVCVMRKPSWILFAFFLHSQIGRT